MESQINETILTALAVGLAIVLALVLVFSQWALYRLSSKLEELVPPELAQDITNLAHKALEQGIIRAGQEVLRVADETETALDNEIARSVLSTRYDIERADDGRYVLMLRREPTPDQEPLPDDKPAT